MRPKNKAILTSLVLAIAPISASANAGTPLMWAGFLHLTIGNAFIGALEGLLLSKFFAVSKTRCVILMIIANYLSTWDGAFLLGRIGEKWYYFDLESAPFWFWILIAAAFLISLLLEFPFVFFAIGKTTRRFPKAILGNLAVQTISYLLLFGWYWRAGDHSILTDLKTIPLSKMQVATNIMVYCIPAGFEEVCVGYLSDGTFQQVQDLPSQGKIDRLAVEINKAETNSTWNLIAVSEKGASWPLLTNLTSLAAEDARRKEGSDIDATHMNFGNASELPGANSNAWKYSTGFWPAEGVRVENRSTGQKRRFALETPFVLWAARNATVLPDGKLLFQLGEDQICLLDAERNEIAPVIRGRGPVAAIER